VGNEVQNGMRLILVGPPGSGKGTQARLLSQKFNLAYIGTGDILREAARLNTPAGRQAQPYLAAGQLVPDTLVNDLVADRFRRDDRPEQFVLDGYPRTLAQAAALDQVLRQQFLDLSAVVQLLVNDEEIVHRLGGRRFCPRCQATYHLSFKPPRTEGICDQCGSPLAQRDDDKEETIRKRLKVYHQTTEAVVNYYQNQGLLRNVEGEGEIQEVSGRIVSALEI
jgi:adenylate kinase